LQEMNEHLRSQERELEQLHHQWEKDLERLRAKNKAELENRVSAQWNLHVHTHTHTHTHTCMHTCTQTHMHTDTDTDIQIHTHTRAHIDIADKSNFKKPVARQPKAGARLV